MRLWAEVEDFLERYDEEFLSHEETLTRYQSAFDGSDQMQFDRTSRAWKKADFYTLFIEVDRILYREGGSIDFRASGLRLTEFFETVNQLREGEEAPVGPAGEYLRATLQSTNDRSTRAVRGRIIREVLLQG
jgi:hypothetical protein